MKSFFAWLLCLKKSLGFSQGRVYLLRTEREEFNNLSSVPNAVMTKRVVLSSDKQNSTTYTTTEHKQLYITVVTEIICQYKADFMRVNHSNEDFNVFIFRWRLILMCLTRTSVEIRSKDTVQKASHLLLTKLQKKMFGYLVKNNQKWNCQEATSNSE